MKNKFLYVLCVCNRNNSYQSLSKKGFLTRNMKRKKTKEQGMCTLTHILSCSVLCDLVLFWGREQTLVNSA